MIENFAKKLNLKIHQKKRQNLENTRCTFRENFWKKRFAKFDIFAKFRFVFAFFVYEQKSPLN